MFDYFMKELEIYTFENKQNILFIHSKVYFANNVSLKEQIIAYKSKNSMIIVQNFYKH